MKTHTLLALALLGIACKGADDGDTDDTDTDAVDTDPGDPVSAPASYARRLAAGGTHTCVLRDDDTMACWGRDTLGVATGREGTWASVWTAPQFSCAVNDAGLTTCWGASGEDRLMAPTDALADVAVGPAHACGLSDAGKLYCWGRVDDGQTRPPAGTGWIDVDVGNDVSCALDGFGRPDCWGRGLDRLDGHDGKYQRIEVGELDACGLTVDGAIGCWGTPTKITQNHPDDTGFKDLVLSETTACAIGSDDGVVCWGGLGDGFGREVVDEVPDGLKAREVTVASGHACAHTLDDELVCWGADPFGVSTIPEGTYDFVATTTDKGCALDAAGAATCWGDEGDYDVIEDGSWSFLHLEAFAACGVTTTGGAVCAPDYRGMTILPSDFTQVVPGPDRDQCGLRGDASGLLADTVLCWGPRLPMDWQNPEGAFQSITAGEIGFCGIRDDDSLLCWRTSASGWPQTGTWKAVDVAAFACAVDTDGELTCWGDQVPDDDLPAGPFDDVAVADIHGCGLRPTGEVVCWGDDVVAPSGTFTQLDAEGVTTCGVRTDGTVECWGELARQSL